MTENDSYLTISGGATSQFVEQRSRFISFAWNVTDTEQVREHIAALQKEYYDARHCCYAYMLGAERAEWRANDNGEPSGTAGKPILGQINSAGLTDILVAVVRYFGGVKLGTSGLIEAYRRAAADVIAASQTVTRYVLDDITVMARYASMNEVMRAVKDFGLTVVAEEYGEFRVTDGDADHAPYDCRYRLRMRRSLVADLTDRVARLTEAEKDASLLIAQSKE